MPREGAFALAGRIRAVRADLLERVRSGDIELSKVLTSEDPFVLCVKVVSVVESLPGLGKVAARRILEEVDVPSGYTIRELDDDTKRALLDRLG